MLAVVFYGALRRPQSEMDRELVVNLLGSAEVQQLRLADDDDLAAFQAGSRTALFFQRKGMQGLIRGVVVSEND